MKKLPFQLVCDDKRSVREVTMNSTDPHGGLKKSIWDKIVRLTRANQKQFFHTPHRLHFNGFYADNGPLGNIINGKPVIESFWGWKSDIFGVKLQPLPLNQFIFAAVQDHHWGNIVTKNCNKFIYHQWETRDRKFLRLKKWHIWSKTSTPTPKSVYFCPCTGPSNRINFLNVQECYLSGEQSKY